MSSHEYMYDSCLVSITFEFPLISKPPRSPLTVHFQNTFHFLFTALPTSFIYDFRYQPRNHNYPAAETAISVLSFESRAFVRACSLTYGDFFKFFFFFSCICTLFYGAFNTLRLQYTRNQADKYFLWNNRLLFSFIHETNFSLEQFIFFISKRCQLEFLAQVFVEVITKIDGESMLVFVQKPCYIQPLEFYIALCRNETWILDLEYWNLMFTTADILQNNSYHTKESEQLNLLHRFEHSKYCCISKTSFKKTAI